MKRLTILIVTLAIISSVLLPTIASANQKDYGGYSSNWAIVTYDSNGSYWKVTKLAVGSFCDSTHSKWKHQNWLQYHYYWWRTVWYYASPEMCGQNYQIMYPNVNVYKSYARSYTRWWNYLVSGGSGYWYTTDGSVSL